MLGHAMCCRSRSWSRKTWGRGSAVEDAQQGGTAEALSPEAGEQGYLLLLPGPSHL